MQISNRLVTGAGNEGNSSLGARAALQVVGTGREEGEKAAAHLGHFDPASRVSLSAEALLYLGRTKRISEKAPALTEEEWSNRLTPQLAAREYQAFGKHGEAGDYKAYYRSFIEYYDSLRTEDQNSLRYFGTRDAAVAGLRSLEYSYEDGEQPQASFQTLVSVLLDSDRQDPPQAPPKAYGAETAVVYGWDFSSISYEDVTKERAAVSGIDQLYAESF